MGWKFTKLAHAATYTWDGGGTTDNWSDCANWSADICPLATDDVSFNATSSKNSVVDAAYAGAVRHLSIYPTYTGTLRLDRDLVTGNFGQQGGNFDGSGHVVDTNGHFTVGGGTFTAPQTLSVSGSFTATSGINYVHNGGTVVFDGSASVSINCGPVVFNLVQFAHSNNTKTVASNCNMPLGADPVITRSVMLNGTLSGSGTLTTSSAGVMTIGSTGVISGFTSQTYGASFNIQAGASYTAPSGNLTVNSHMTIDPTATFIHNNGNLIITANTTATIACGNALFNTAQITNTAATKTIGSECNLPLGTNPTLARAPVLNGTLSGSGTLTIGGGLTVNSAGSLNGFSGLVLPGLISNSTSLDLGSYSSVDIDGSLTIGAGSGFIAPSSMMVSGNLTINPSASFDANGGTLIIDGTTTATLSCGGATFNLVSIQHTTRTKTINADCTLPLGNNPSNVGTFILNGTLTGSGTLQMASQQSLTINATGQITGITALSHNDSVNVSSLIINSNSNPFPDLVSIVFPRFTMNNSTLDASNFTTFYLSSFSLLGSSVFTAPSGEFTMNGGSFSVDATSTFNHNNGTFNSVDGTGQIINGNTTFYNFIKHGYNSIQFQAGSTTTIEGNLSLKGGDGVFMGLYSSTTGTQWMINPTGTIDIERVRVRDSNNINPTVITAVNSVDGGNNTNWSIQSPIYPGYAASDVVGQDNLTIHSILSGANATPESTYYPNGTLVDTLNHRLFIPTCGDRILVFNLDEDNNLLDKTADYALGQPSTSGDMNLPAAQNSLNCPGSLSMDTEEQLLFVPDYHNHRLVVYDLSGGITTGMNASYVLGQSDFTTSAYANAVTASNFYNPMSTSYDSDNKLLFVADTFHERVLVFDFSSGITNNMSAAYVLGKPDFTTQGDTFSESGLGIARAIIYDRSNKRLFVCDRYNNRVLVYDLSEGITSGMDASYVFGQPDLNTRGKTGVATDKNLDNPASISYDEKNQLLFVADQDFNRLLVFDANEITNNESAIMVIGQGDFVSSENDCAPTATTTCYAYAPVDDFDPVNRRLYFSDEELDRVLIFNFIKLNNTAMATGAQGTTYSHQVPYSNSQGTVSFSITSGSLPAGLELDPVTGIVNGTPTVPGVYEFTVRAGDDNGSFGSIFDVQTYQITVNPRPPSITDDTVADNLSQTAVLATTGQNTQKWLVIIASLLLAGMLAPVLARKRFV